MSVIPVGPLILFGLALLVCGWCDIVLCGNAMVIWLNMHIVMLNTKGLCMRQDIMGVFHPLPFVGVLGMVDDQSCGGIAAALLLESVVILPRLLQGLATHMEVKLVHPS